MSQSQNIFDKGDEPYGNATIGWAPDGWDLYVYGFRRAAEILLTHVEEKHTSLDVIVFPTVFLLRHHLELAIKLINRDARLLLDRPRPERAEHRLQVLWDQTKELIIEVVGVEPLGLGPIDEVVKQFHAIDPSSTTFRYPETLDGTDPLSGLSNINLLTLRDSLEPAFDMLDAVHTQMRLYRDGY